jgi:hypothetical protein
VYDKERIVIYDTTTAKPTKTLFFKTKGIGIVKFTHSNQGVMISTLNSPYELLYWNLYSNEVTKKFEISQENKVSSLYRNPKNDLFVCTQEDFSFRLFDIS